MHVDVCSKLSNLSLLHHCTRVLAEDSADQAVIVLQLILHQAGYVLHTTEQTCQAEAEWVLPSCLCGHQSADKSG